MPEKSKTETPTPTEAAPENNPKVAATPNVATAATYDSNPFTTTFAGIKKLLTVNLGSFIGLSFFAMLLSLVLVLSLVAVFLALAAINLQNNPDITATGSMAYNATVMGMNSATIVSSLVLGPILFLASLVLSISMPLKLVIASSANQKIGFGQLFKAGLKPIFPILGLALLSFAVAIVASILLALLSQVLGVLNIILIIAAFIAWIYIALRLTFSLFIIIEDGLGPIKAIKQSWVMTQGHLAEVFGIIGATSTIVLVPLIILMGLASLTQAVPVISIIFAILGFIVTIIVQTATYSGFSERFIQLRSLLAGQVSAPKIHVLNYLSIFIFVGLTIITSLMLPQQSLQMQNQQNDELQQQLDQFEQELQQNQHDFETLPREDSTDFPVDSTEPEEYHLH